MQNLFAKRILVLIMAMAVVVASINFVPKTEVKAAGISNAEVCFFLFFLAVA